MFPPVLSTIFFIVVVTRFLTSLELAKQAKLVDQQVLSICFLFLSSITSCLCVCVCPCTSARVPVRRVVLGLRSKCLQGKHFLYCVISPDRFYYSQLVLSLMAQLGYHHPFNRHTGGKGRQGHTPCKSFTSSVLHLFHDYNLAAREAEAVFIVSVYVPR